MLFRSVSLTCPGPTLTSASGRSGFGSCRLRVAALVSSGCSGLAPLFLSRPPARRAVGGQGREAQRSWQILRGPADLLFRKTAKYSRKLASSRSSAWREAPGSRGQGRRGESFRGLVTSGRHCPPYRANARCGVGRLAGGSNPSKSSPSAGVCCDLRVMAVGPSGSLAGGRVSPASVVDSIGNGMGGTAPRGVRLFGRRKALQAEPQER